jgi:hypothetical protein
MIVSPEKKVKNLNIINGLGALPFGGRQSGLSCTG